MKSSPTADDPRHYTTRDGRIMPVTGTHTTEPCGFLIGSVPCGADRALHAGPDWLAGHRFVPTCATCQREPARVLADSIPLGALVTWAYGRYGRAHGRVIEQRRTRVRLWWHKTNGTGYDLWRPARDLTREEHRTVAGCAQCEAGR